MGTNRTSKKILKFIFCISISALILTSCSTMENVNSTWKSKEIKIDGNDDEWQGFAQYFPDDRVMISTRNDSNNLYLCLKTNDQTTIRKIMGGGLTLWLNGKAEKLKSFGIHYPVGMMGKDGMPQRGKTEENQDDFTVKNQEKRQQRMLDNVELLKDDGKDINATKIDEIKTKYNISLALLRKSDELVYEISIPYKSGIDALKTLKPENKELGLGFETAEFKRPESSNRGNRPSGGEGMPPMGGGEGMPPMGGGGFGGRQPMGGRGGGRHGGGQRGSSSMEENTKPIQIWIDLKLAEKDKDVK